MNTKDLKKIRSFLKKNILNNATQYVNKDNEKMQSEIFNLLLKTVVHGESNSMLLIGPKGVGKTALIKTVLTELKSVENYTQNCIIVKLHGLLHTDDKLALKSITSQMELDNAVDGKIFGSFSENLGFLLACLRTGERHSSKSIVFILNDFHLFCSHHNQTLLYNLFDVAQSAHSPICILGLTCRIDVIQLLEKRVKSRFSHRQLFMYPGDNSDDNGDEEFNSLAFSIAQLKYYLAIPDSEHSIRISSTTKNNWNEDIKNLVENKKFKNLIQRVADLDVTLQILKTITLKCIYSLSAANSKLDYHQFERELNLWEKDDTIQVLKDLSALELCLIIAMKHHCEIYDDTPMNFEMIYHRYVKFATKHSNMQNIQRPVVMKAFEHIEKLELISMLSQQGNSKLQKEYQCFKLLLTNQQIYEAISQYPGLPTEIVQWSTSSLE